eukprot:CAMPEP_0194521834 /NCGR_PEP_ID=MMETSP0253-20130528/56249_1 /TAXON_ID=2966 /ORGANISM="Noctiluca scintillans" /LENGTH=133 /DNA_ID=CAMNT_0039366217 /DNA_START=311 /DNA_END=709 /DNA_ORIENTATION=-
MHVNDARAYEANVTAPSDKCPRERGGGAHPTPKKWRLAMVTCPLQTDGANSRHSVIRPFWGEEGTETPRKLFPPTSEPHVSEVGVRGEQGSPTKLAECTTHSTLSAELWIGGRKPPVSVGSANSRQRLSASRP